jgi:hypothetical protein
VAVAGLAGIGSAQAIIGSDLDAGGHPAAGLLAVPGADGLVPECSGVLVAPRVFVTAGHCTEAALAAGGAYVVFGDTVDPGTWQPLAGSATTDPAYGHDSANPHDLGVVVLDEPAPAVVPASLPRLGAADGLAKAATAPVSVGYGYSQRQKKGFVYDGLRHSAQIAVASETSTLLRLGDSSASQLCFGDSGGPQYLAGTSTVVSVTSAGSPSCEGNATATRLDSASSRAFLARFVPLP